MRVFVTGASGFVGSAVVQELLQAGHRVTGLARSDTSAKALVAAGAAVHPGTLEDLESLRSGAAASDGVIHLAFLHQFSDASLMTRFRTLLRGVSHGLVPSVMAMMAGTDKRAIETIGSTLAGSGRPLVVTSGTLLLPQGHLATENDLPDPKAAAAFRIPSEQATMAVAERGVRASVVRLPPSVHGDGDCGFVPRLIGIARKKGVSAYVGDGLNRWPAVHRLDAAQLFRLALEKGSAGAHYHGVADESVTFRDIAEVLGRRLNSPVISKKAGHFGFLGAPAASDNPTSSRLTQEALGWCPTRASLIPDIDRPSYFEPRANR